MVTGATLVAAASINIACTEVCATAEGGWCTCSCGGRNHSMSSPSGLVPFTSTAGSNATLALTESQRAMFSRGGDYTQDELKRHWAAIGNLWFNNGGGEDAEHKLTDAQLAARNNYISGDYDRINHRLRIGAHGARTKTVTQLDKAIKASSIEDTMVVFRGVHGTFAEQLEIGDTLTDAAFLSTAVDPKHAAQFTRNSNTIIAIELPAATRAVRGNPAETEYILPTKTTLEVVGFEAWPHPDGGSGAVHVVKTRLVGKAKKAALTAATTINVPCTDACQSAEGGSCTCSCGGRNHSFADGVRVPYQSSASKALAIDMHQWQHQSWNANREGGSKDAARLMMLLHMRSVTTPQRLSEAEQHGVDAYTSPMFDRINRALRDDDWDTLRQVKTVGINKTAAAAVESLDDAILRGYVPQDTAVFRGLTGSFAEKLEVGDVITDGGYMSTTVDPTTAAQFGRGDTMMMLEVPKGTPAAAGNRAEYELVLSRGSSVEIVGFEAWEAANGDVAQVVKARYRLPDSDEQREAG